MLSKTAKNVPCCYGQTNGKGNLSPTKSDNYSYEKMQQNEVIYVQFAVGP